ncbi:MAG TPA: replication-associated recombination protein A [Phycisphaerae bacterium]|nr:replication-associated recombination protein A [Phycisphaerae bacterium]
MGLFNESERRQVREQAPLAVRMRPRTPEEFVGQGHFFGPGKLLRRMIDADRLQSAIFYGPPGTGKTSLAEVIAGRLSAAFEQMNAAMVGVKEVREVLGRARDRLLTTRQRTVLFLDEVHRFNRAQQDVLLPDVEDGVVVLIGATTENPFFALNAPLVSRSQIFRFEPLSEADVRTLLGHAMTDTERGLGRYRLTVTDEALDHWAKTSDGDARRALAALEVAVLSQVKNPLVPPEEAGPIAVDLAVAEESIQQKALVYDGTGDEHYDAASAFIKSMRGSDPDAALYWMARMLEAGEDPRFVARRAVICAAEDVGNADPAALMVAVAAMHAAEFVGMPEARIPLAEAVTYIACAPKSNAAYLAIDKAMEDVRENRTIPVPKHLRDAHYDGAKRFGHGEGYKYAHNFEGGVAPQDYLGVDKTYYEPTDHGHEAKLKKRLQEFKRLRRDGPSGGGPAPHDAGDAP